MPFSWTWSDSEKVKRYRSTENVFQYNISQLTSPTSLTQKKQAASNARYVVPVGEEATPRDDARIKDCNYVQTFIRLSALLAYCSHPLALRLCRCVCEYIYLSIYMYIYLRLQLNTLSADSFNNKKERIFHEEPIPRARSQNRQNLISPRFRRSSPIFNRSSKSAARTSTHHPCVWRSPLPPP